MRRRLAFTLLTVLTILCVPAVASARTLGIGDSVMKGAADELKDLGFRVNAVVSRQFSEGPGVVRDLRAAGKLPNRVVVHLGNNGYLSMDQCRDLVAAVGNRSLWLVNVHVPRQWREDNDRRLARCARRFDNVTLIDWAGYSNGHTGWFADDGYHLSTEGARRYAAYLDRFV